MDRIYEAYMGGMGDSFAEKTKKRIHWICSKVQGRNILDVGCSQGITAILLAREGLQVTGLDISEETIIRAKEYLSQEAENVQSRVDFRQADFGCFSSVRRYDTVIMGEVLEHLQHPQIFIANAAKVLADNGQLIVTVPFGINDDPDHKQTFYYFALTHLLEAHFQISETEFFGKWIGFVASKIPEPEARNNLQYEECLKVEQAFYAVERDYINQCSAIIKKHTEYQQQLQEKLKKSEENYQIIKQWLNDKNAALEQINSQKKQFEADIAKMTREKDSLTHHKALLEQKLIKTEKAYEDCRNCLKKRDLAYASLQEENSRLEEKLKQNQKLLSDSEKLLADEERFLKTLQTEVHAMKWKSVRYDALHNRLSHSWYGRVMLTCYRKLRKIKAAFCK